MAEKGVNVTKSPIHLEDGELTKAQNWQTDPTLADGAIRRRDALVKLNSSALAGAVKGLIALPYPDNFTTARTFYAAIDDATTNTWRVSTTGAAASWSTITDSTLRKAQNSVNVGGTATFGVLRGLQNWASHNHKIYFPGQDYNSPAEAGTNTPPTVYSWDGTTALKLFTAPPEPNCYPNSGTSGVTAVTSIVPYSKTELLIGVLSRAVASSRYFGSLLLYDTVTGALEQLGSATSLQGELIFAPYVFQNRIWLASTYFDLIGNINHIRWIRPGDSAWTTDADFHAASIGGTTMAEFLGDLYLGTHSAAATVATIRKRTTATGAWSTVKSTDGVGTGQYIGPLIVTADGLTILAFYNTNNGTAPVLRILSSTDGTTWVTDLDIDADLGATHFVSGIPYLDSDGSIYWPIRKSDDTGFIKKRTSAGVWSTVDTIAALHGPMQALKVVT